MINTYEGQLRCGVEEIADSIFFRNITDYPILHAHDYFEIAIFISGQYNHLINGETLVTNPGDCFLMRPNDEHLVQAIGPCGSHINITLRPEKFRALTEVYSKGLYDMLMRKRTVHFVINPQQMNSVSELVSSVNDKRSQNDREISANLVLSRLMNYVVEQNAFPEGKKPSWLKELLFEISKPENLVWRSDDVKKRSHFSKTHLNRCFQQYLGKSVGDYLIDVKMGAAEDYLLHSELSMGEIATALGYSSVSHFNHLFKKQFGKSPLAYKKANQ